MKIKTNAEKFLESKGIDYLTVPGFKTPLKDGKQTHYTAATIMEQYHAAAMAASSEPFDPAKHLEGWVKDKKYSQWFFAEFTLTQYDSSRYALEHNKRFETHSYYGPIPTHAFFHALCGALNIKA